MADEETERSAKFNSGIAKLMRIGKLKEACHDSRVFDNPKSWFAALQGIRTEINSKFTREARKNGKRDEPPERETADNYENIAKLYFKNKRNIQVEINGSKGRVENVDIRELLYDYELWLGDMEEKYKFGMPDYEDDGL